MAMGDVVVAASVQVLPPSVEYSYEVSAEPDGAVKPTENEVVVMVVKPVSVGAPAEVEPLNWLLAVPLPPAFTARMRSVV